MPHKDAESIKPGEKFTFEGQPCIRVDVSGPNILDKALGQNTYGDGSWHPEVRQVYEWSFGNIAAGLASVDVGGYVLAFNTSTGRLMLLKHCTQVDSAE